MHLVKKTLANNETVVYYRGLVDEIFMDEGETQSLRAKLESIESLITANTNKFSGYLARTGGTMTGPITSSVATSQYIYGNRGTAIINSTAAAGYNVLARMKSTNGVFTVVSHNAEFGVNYTADTVIAAGTNAITKHLKLLGEDGSMNVPGTITATGFSGNASSATKLQTARAISIGGVSKNFDGTAGITITKAELGIDKINNTADSAKSVASAAKWTTARSLTIGSATKSIDGSANVSFTSKEIFGTLNPLEVTCIKIGAALLSWDATTKSLVVDFA